VTYTVMDHAGARPVPTFDSHGFASTVNDSFAFWAVVLSLLFGAVIGLALSLFDVRDVGARDRAMFVGVYVIVGATLFGLGGIAILAR